MITLTLPPAVFQILFKESNALFREIKNGHYLILIKPFQERAISLFNLLKLVLYFKCSHMLNTFGIIFVQEKLILYWS